MWAEVEKGQQWVEGDGDGEHETRAGIDGEGARTHAKEESTDSAGTVVDVDVGAHGDDARAGDEPIGVR